MDKKQKVSSFVSCLREVLHARHVLGIKKNLSVRKVEDGLRGLYAHKTVISRYKNIDSLYYAYDNLSIDDKKMLIT